MIDQLLQGHFREGLSWRASTRLANETDSAMTYKESGPGPESQQSS